MAAAKKTPTPAPEPTPWTLEDLLTSPRGFNLKASPLQRAICRIIDGLPLEELADLPELERAVGGKAAVDYLRNPAGKPLEVYLISGSRVGKTLLTAAIIFKATQTVQVSHLGRGDEPRAPVLSLDKDKANACYLHLVNNLKGIDPATGKPGPLASTIVHDGRNELDSPAVWIRHPSGREVQVCVAANKAAGNAVVAYWLASVVFDEACKMAGSGDASVNFEDTRKNCLTRLLPGAQLVAIGSPWAPFGPMYDAVQSRLGKPGPDLVVIKARGRDMNPAHWTPEKIASTPADILRTEEGAEFQALEESIYAEEVITRPEVCRPDAAPVPYDPTLEYAASMDPATRSNAWTLAIGTRKNGRLVVAYHRQWLPRPGLRLVPSEVLKEIAADCRRYNLNRAITDQWSTDALRDIARAFGLSLVEVIWTGPGKVEAFTSLSTAFLDGMVEIPRDPDLLLDLKMTKKRTTQEGMSIVLPKAKGSHGLERHCDYAPSLARLAVTPIREVKPPVVEPPEVTIRKLAIAKAQERSVPPWKQDSRHRSSR